MTDDMNAVIRRRARGSTLTPSTDMNARLRQARGRTPSTGSTSAPSGAAPSAWSGAGSADGGAGASAGAAPSMNALIRKQAGAPKPRRRR